ncbi:MAG: tetratricopeptide repeat protein [Pseudobdellovibrio sp.]
MLNTNEAYLEAVNLFKNAQYKKAFLKLISLSQKFSNDLDYLKLLSEVQLGMKDFESRLKTLQVISRKSSSVDDKLKYMVALLLSNRRNESLDEAIKLMSLNLTRDQRIFISRNLIKIYSCENDFEGLEEVCRELQSAGVTDAEIEYSLALVEASKGNLDAAIDYLRKAVMLNVEFDTGWAALGLYHYQKGDVELAKANLEKALDINPVNATALKHISQWVDSNQPEELKDVLAKVNYYLQQFNFDEEISECHAKLLIQNGHVRTAQFEAEKLSYYFGK